MNGRLVVFEGLDGCGKSTQLARASAWLREAGHDPLVTREPTDGSWGRRIREMAKSGQSVAPEEELRWFLEDRREHVSQELRPALAAGRLVLCDRYYLSTAAYQGARGLDWRGIMADSEAEFPSPDLVLLYEIAPEQGLQRVRARGGALEVVFESADFLERVGVIFAEIDRPYLERIPAEGTPDEVEAATRRALARRLDLAL